MFLVFTFKAHIATNTKPGRAHTQGLAGGLRYGQPIANAQFVTVLRANAPYIVADKEEGWVKPA